MTKDKAREAAIFRMAQTGNAYSIVQARNGQWMCERTTFIKDDPRGRMLYSGRPAEHLGYLRGEWVEK